MKLVEYQKIKIFMNINKEVFWCIPVMLILCSFAIAQEIDWYSIDSGGGISTSGNTRLIGVIGQLDTVRMNGGNLSLSGGYLPLENDAEKVFLDGFESG